MSYIGNVNAFESVGTSDLEDGAVTVVKLNAAVANSINPSLGTASIIRTNAKVIAENITFAGTENGSSVGPITVASTYTVTVASGSTWVIL
tara:strand:+ start:856 stop:1128 length:273 start_codon:yes stop_codon:yes gene_type:complete